MKKQQPNPKGIGEILLAFKRKIAESSKKSFFKPDITFSQMETLMFIGPSGSKTMDSIADYLKITPPSATSLIEKMEKKGLVIRMRNRKDRRVVSIRLSSKTKKEIGVLWKEREKVLNQIVSKLSAQDKKHFIRIMRILIED